MAAAPLKVAITRSLQTLGTARPELDTIPQRKFRLTSIFKIPPFSLFHRWKFYWEISPHTTTQENPRHARPSPLLSVFFASTLDNYWGWAFSRPAFLRRSRVRYEKFEREPSPRLGVGAQRWMKALRLKARGHATPTPKRAVDCNSHPREDFCLSQGKFILWGPVAFTAHKVSCFCCRLEWELHRRSFYYFLWCFMRQFRLRL